MTDAKPILFSTAMVQALLAGRKLQTRRVVKPQPAALWGGTNLHSHVFNGLKLVGDRPSDHYWLCPHGRPGDLLWVKESWAYRLDCDHLNGTQLYERGVREAWYWADGPEKCCRTGCAGAAGRVRTGRFMPRWASRITLRIADVRVERLQEISEADAIAEGVERVAHPAGLDEPAWKSYEIIHEGRHKGKPNPHSVVPNRSAITSYRELWENLNGPKSWDANPWIWRICFERIQ